MVVMSSFSIRNNTVYLRYQSRSWHLQAMVINIFLQHDIAA